ncbi:hypothetical protein T11_6067 [Trichinella zimbabwensis]|uniref:Uncharacterized protein n=1 Tax=Trichinella zimbabwensis TaxID=268475 RepID=A0A0V1HPD6_9BILA|nr:hypothetical protein T11_6067 [Trichinella zimbabwensis]
MPINISTHFRLHDPLSCGGLEVRFRIDESKSVCLSTLVEDCSHNLGNATTSPPNFESRNSSSLPFLSFTKTRARFTSTFGVCCVLRLLICSCASSLVKLTPSYHFIHSLFDAEFLIQLLLYDAAISVFLASPLQRPDHEIQPRFSRLSLLCNRVDPHSHGFPL